MSTKRTVYPVLPQVNVETLPRVSIVQDKGQFAFNDFELPNSVMNDVILLGLIRQRSWWDFQVGGRVCGSLDFAHGVPDVERFPWDDSNFDRPLEGSKVELSCGSCSFKDWQRDPSTPRGSVAPPCREQYQVPLLVPALDGDTEDERGNLYIQYRLGFITFQKSSQKAAHAYMKNFQSRKHALYTKTTRMRLELNLAKEYKYSVPTFKENHEVSPRAYRSLSAMLAAARDMLMQPPSPTRAKTGGMLSVSVDAEQPARYSGSFFS